MRTDKLFQILFLLLLTGCAGSAFASITIDSSRTTSSNCANDGVINIYAHSSSSLLYAITSGPDIRPAQSGNQFGALLGGVYQVMVTNFSNDTAWVTATITSTYAFPDFAPTFTDPICPGSNTGSIICHALNGTGRSPYTWVLTEIATGTVTTQTSDTFPDLSAGDYQVRMYDSCQAFATRFVTLSNHYNSLQAHYLFHSFIACDTDVISIVLESNTGTWSPPFVVTTYWGGNSKTDTINPPVVQGNTVLYLYDTIGGMHYGDGAGMSVIDACGNSAGWGSQSDVWDPQAQVYPINDSCQAKYRPGFVLTSSFPPNTAFYTPVYFQVWDSMTGATIDSVVLSPGSSYYSPSYFLQPNRWYKMRVYDSCGHNTIKYFTTPVPDTTNLFVTKYASSCLDSTAKVDIHCINFASTSIRMTILSGPPIAQSSTPRFAHRDTITYPISNFVTGSCSGTYLNDICFGVVGLPVGTYTYRAEDSCGNSRTDSFVIENQDVAVYGFDRSIIKGCPGQNKIKYQLHHLPYNYIQDFVRLYPLNSTNAIDSSISDSAVFSNLNAGTYRIYHRANAYASSTNFISSAMQCTAIDDTIVVSPYQIPRIDYATQIKCNGTVNVGLQPDSSTGVPPYEYEIISGPQMAAVQASEFFTFTIPGNYVARISDTCGFARTFSFYVDTLSFQQIVKVGSSCLGNGATLVGQHSPYATYVWHKPNGGVYTGDSLYISPVNATDYGTYQIEKIVAVNNCTDTFYTTYLLTSSSITYQTATICNHQSFSFGGNSYSVAGTYYDTIPTAFCDSIVALNLNVGGFIYDSVSQNICAGQSITVGANVYSATGIYRDTFSTTTCDSIYILNLTVTNLKRDSVALTICTGQTISVGVNTYSTTGIYRDTFSTAGCDSIYILNLTVTNLKRDSVALTICTGQTISVGANTYSTTGIYRDTFSTATCDSVHILNLTVTNLKRDSVTLTICTGQSITVGASVYSTTGIYRDTFSTATCDSVCILNLTVTSLKRDSVSLTICTGQSIIVGANVYSTTGIYRDTFSTSTCDSVHILNLTVTNLKRDSVTLTICTGQSIIVGANVYSATGIYRDTFSTTACDSVHILNLTVTNLKRDSVALTICTGQSITVGANVYSSTGIYRDTFSTAYCDSVYILNLTVLPAKHDTVFVQFCEGESVTIGHQTFSQAGSFTDTIFTSSCDSLLTVVASTFPKPAIEITASAAEVDAGDTVQLKATENFSYSYLWTSITVFNNAFISNPIASIAQSSWVIVQVSDTNNCTASDSVFIKVKDCEESIFVPNAFTPNGDGNNDVFYIYGNCLRMNSFYVFNRWGEKMWDSNDISQGWNGYYKGVMQPMGVYVYLVNYSTSKAVGRTLKGSVTLVR